MKTKLALGFFLLVMLIAPTLQTFGQGGFYNGCYSCMREPLNLVDPIFVCCRGSACETYSSSLQYIYVQRDYFIDCKADQNKNLCVGKVCEGANTTWDGGPITETEEECNGF